MGDFGAGVGDLGAGVGDFGAGVWAFFAGELMVDRGYLQRYTLFCRNSSRGEEDEVAENMK